MLDFEVNGTVDDFCRDVLKKRFPGDPIRQQINDTDRDKLNFACPFCGDSKKDPNKKRGNLYLTTGTYKCYNDGCGVWIPLTKFVAALSRKYEVAPPSINKPKLEFKINKPTKRRGSLIEFLINQQIGVKLLDFSEIVRRFSLIPCKNAPVGSPIYEYVLFRKINTLPVFEKTCYYDSRENKIYLFNLDLRSNKILGFAVRHIDPNYMGPKYNIKNYAEFKRTGLVLEIDDDSIQAIDQVNNYFNVLNVNFSKELTITEGQIDSMFIRNCVAATGVSKSNQLLDNLASLKNTRILFDNDNAGRLKSIELIKKGYRVFMWAHALKELKIKYPKHISQIKRIKDVNDLFIFMNLMNEAITYDKFNEFIDSNFSSSTLDIIFL